MDRAAMAATSRVPVMWTRPPVKLFWPHVIANNVRLSQHYDIPALTSDL